MAPHPNGRYKLHLANLQPPHHVTSLREFSAYFTGAAVFAGFKDLASLLIFDLELLTWLQIESKVERGACLEAMR
jgi:hypothetical protein